MFADIAAWEWATTGTESTNGNWTFGQVFTPTTNIKVDFLGYFDPSTGMLDGHPVSIWNGTTGALVASSTITSASGFSSTHFLYNMISPVTLQAGQIYEITGVSGIDNYAYGDTGWTLFAPVTYWATTIAYLAATSPPEPARPILVLAMFGWTSAPLLSRAA